MAAFVTMIYRQFMRFLRSRSRVIGMIINPLIWIIFFGLGWSKVFDNPWAKMMFGGVDYLTYLAPGIFAMTVFNMSFISGVSLIWDKQFGFFKEVLVAPSSRRLSITGRIVGDAIVTVLQGLIILVFNYFLAESLKISGLLPALAVGFLMSVTIASFGIALALKMESTEGFQMIMMTLMMPLVFLSGAMYPIDSMPNWMKALAYINPLTYAVDASRGYLVGEKVMKFSFGLDWGILSILMLVGLILAMESFERARIS
ncbi:ABC transporter [Thermotoga maritima MSB8]|jgi:ABC-2 type transport system permease protein|uniref:Transport permease protein n=1 Tax=Thermotoga maritima (strain ATCC 43589 / DSM 3109 / JCM 10099 / NBRC 100826 / MSB8) TaxID=243274 RepID=Q9X1C4_THEMA|nr:ABC transporter permease [Thermotoga maritima]HBU00039.1 ABC transporter [Thermotoga petrophila]AAD36475.1 antibiotic ABC transporter, transmembrane protein, putative [Thermotoga maritima MSB8]AGL50335.1 ABC-type multidrug transport system, permease component [Thermotoga maritima MSB8]AHD18700.1 ABC transporter [Thermotoga maritima MSB8]AKE27294.1 ABC transporter [Thermotoga maritima]